MLASRILRSSVVPGTPRPVGTPFVQDPRVSKIMDTMRRRQEEVVKRKVPAPNFAFYKKYMHNKEFPAEVEKTYNTLVEGLERIKLQKLRELGYAPKEEVMARLQKAKNEKMDMNAVVKQINQEISDKQYSALPEYIKKMMKDMEEEQEKRFDEWLAKTKFIEEHRIALDQFLIDFENVQADPKLLPNTAELVVEEQLQARWPKKDDHHH